MAKIDFNLASQRLNTGGSPGGLTPVQLNPNPAANIQNPAISIHAGDVRFTPIEPPPIVIDRSLDAAADFAQTWVNASYKYNERMFEAKADQLVLNAESEIVNLLYGTEDQPGYVSTQGQAAQDAYNPVADRVKQVVKQYTEGAEPAVQAKALLRLKSLENHTLTVMAKHRTGEFRVWQQNIEDAKRERLKRELYSKANDPEEFTLAMLAHLEAMDERLGAQPDLASREKFAFVNEVFSDITDSLIKTEQFGLAAEYITQGMSTGADPNIMATRLGQLETSMRQAEAARLRQEALERERIRALEEEQANAIAMNAIKTGDLAQLQEIPNVLLKAKYINAASTVVEGVDNPNAMLEVMSRYAELSENPTRLLDPEVAPGLTFAQRASLIKDFQNDARTGDNELIKQSVDWAKTILPTIDNSLYGPMLTAEGKDLLTKMESKITNAIRDARAEGKDTRVAMYEARAEILNDPNFSKNYTAASVGREDLRTIEYLKDYDGGLFSVENVLDKFQKPEEKRTVVDRTFGKMVSLVDQKYGAVVKNGKIDRTLLRRNLRNDRTMRLNYMRDLEQLMMQRRYYYGKITQDTKAIQ